MIPEASNAIVEWTWIHYNRKINATDALHIFLLFINHLIEDRGFENLHECMKKSIEHYLAVAPRVVNSTHN